MEPLGMRQRGFTVFEMLVSLTIMAFIVFVAVPYAGAWIYGANVNTTSALTQHSFGRTRALAMENRNSITDGSATAYLCLANGKLNIQTINQPTCGTNPVWSAAVVNGVSLASGASAFSCMGLNNLGLPVALTLSGTACTTARAITVSQGSVNVTNNLY